MHWADYFHDRGRSVLESAVFVGDGVKRRRLATACELGELIRPRRGHYVLGDTDPRVVEAVRVGGRLACVSAVRHADIFGFDDGRVHVHVGALGSRLRDPRNRSQALRESDGSNAKVHWGALMEPSGGNEYRVGLVDAIRQAFMCQDHRVAMATLENALHLNRLPEGTVPVIFSALPGRLQWLRSLVDDRSESGQETVLRLILIEAGFRVDIQVSIESVGRVDMLVDGLVVVEADSRQFHDGWEAHARDRARDVDLAALGYMSLRVLYRDIMFDQQRVISAVRGLLSSHATYPRET